MRALAHEYALALCALTACATQQRAPTARSTAAPPQPSVTAPSVARAPRPRVVTPELRTLRRVEVAEAHITPEVTASVVAHRSGVVRVVYVNANDPVRAGQVLAVVGPANGASGRTEQLRAPIDGVVLTRAVEPTTPVDGDHTVLFTIADLTRLAGHASIPEARARMLRVGLRVVLRVDAMPERSFDAAVTGVGQTIDAAHRQPFEFALANRELTLRPGMHGEARVELDRHDDALVLPDDALTSYTEPVVFVVSEGRARPVNVHVGLRVDGVTEITDGIGADARVLAPAAGLHEDDPVDE